IRIGQRNLSIGRGKHLLLDRFQALDLARELGKLLLEMRRLRSERFRRLLQVGGVELAQIPCHALLDLSEAALHLRAREILVAVVDRFELTAVDGNARFRQQAHLSAKPSIARTGLSSQIQSSRHSGNSVACARSVPSTKRLIRSSRESLARLTRNEAFLHSLGRPGVYSTGVRQLALVGVGINHISRM